MRVALSPFRQTLLHVVALIGCFTALLASLIALTQNDLKRVLAYSTISQLGYMFLGLGIGSLTGIIFAMFHLFTHAFFKALLFLGAGSVMHAMGGVVDMRRFSGLRRIMPTTCWTFLFGCLALSGIIPFAGYWSKDGIPGYALYEPSGQEHGSQIGVPSRLAVGRNSFHQILYWTATPPPCLTAFYTFRAFFLTFCGPERVPPEAGHHAHESPRSMTVPLIVLAVFAFCVGWLFKTPFRDFLVRTPSLCATWIKNPEGPESAHDFVAAVSTVAALAGIGLAAFLYLGEATQAAWLAAKFKPLYELSYRKFFFDPIYDWLVVRPLAGLAAICNWAGPMGG